MASKQGLSKSCILLIVISGMERFAFKGVASNLVTYLTDVVKMSNSAAAKTVNSWCGFTSIMPLLVAPIADSFWDLYSTILASSFLYILGLAAVTSTAFDWPWVPRGRIAAVAFLMWSLCLISLGQGGYNPSLQAFGADQLGEEDDLPSTETHAQNTTNKKRTLFFTWWYFGVCTGSLLGVSLMAYIQDTLGWSLGFAIPTIVMVFSILLFVCGTWFYTYNQHRDVDCNPSETRLQAAKDAISRMFSCMKGGSDSKDQILELEMQDKPLCKQKLVSNKQGISENQRQKIPLVENLKVVLRLLPIWTMLLMFAVIFQQPATFFTKQGMTMRRSIGRSGFKIPPATLQGVITVSIIILMPMYDKLLVPLTQFITHNKKGISVKQRMGVGMSLSVVAMVIAALVEVKRLSVSKKIVSDLKSQSEIVPLSILWLLPQYILLGISDIFTVVGMQEFFYSEVPVKMRTMGIALYTSVFGVGSFLSAFLISMIELLTGGKHSWFSDDMREARLDKYYWLLAIASAFSLLLYVVLCKFYKSANDLDNATR